MPTAALGRELGTVVSFGPARHVAGWLTRSAQSAYAPEFTRLVMSVDRARLAAAGSGLPQPGEIIAQKYRVERVVGAGGMGVVLAARHVQLGQVVALKLLAAADEERRAEASARFLREAQAAAGLRCDHVVRIYDVGTLDDGRPFMVMELLDGVDGSELLDTQGPQPVPVVLQLVLQACEAVAAAHAAGIVHRDLKPSNLFITQRSDGTPWLKVLDFGISKTVQAGHGGDAPNTLTSTRALMGSPHYMSPEQIRDSKHVDPRTDIWSLGIILHELLAGVPAFSAESLPGVCAAIVADPPPQISQVRADVSPELQAIILRCLEKDPARRYQTVSELAQALRSLTGVAPSGGAARLTPRTAVASSGVNRRTSLTPSGPAGSSDATLASLDAPGPEQAVAPVEAPLIKTQISPSLEPRAAEPDQAASAPAASAPASGVASEARPPRERARWALVGATVLLVGFGAVLIARASRAPSEPAPPSQPTSAPRASAGREPRDSLHSAPSGTTAIEGARSPGPAARVPEATQPDAAATLPDSDAPDAAPRRVHVGAGRVRSAPTASVVKAQHAPAPASDADASDIRLKR